MTTLISLSNTIPPLLITSVESAENVSKFQPARTSNETADVYSSIIPML